MLEDRDVILEVPVVFPRHFDDVLPLGERYPRLRYRDRPSRQAAARQPRDARWATDLALVSEHPNVFSKVSGLNTSLATPDWSTTDLQHCVEVALDCFGPERLMCGSDWPVALLNGDYDRRLAGLNVELATMRTPAPKRRIRCSAATHSASMRLESRRVTA